MSYKVSEEGNITAIHLDGEIDMDVVEKEESNFSTYELEKEFI